MNDQKANEEVPNIINQGKYKLKYNEILLNPLEELNQN